MARKLAFSTIALLLGLLILEGLAGLALAFRGDTSRAFHEETHCRYDADLGWANIPSYSNPAHFGSGIGFHANGQGFRGAKATAPEPPDGRFRILFLGDSFTEGFGCADADTFPAQVETLEPRIEAVNMGLGGYGLDQFYLAYRREGPKYRHHLVLVTLIAHDLERMTRKDFLGRPKPYLEASGEGFEVRNVPVPEGFGRDALAGAGGFASRTALGRVIRRIAGRPDAPAVERSAAELPASESKGTPAFTALLRPVLRGFQSLAKERGATLVFAYLPTRFTLPREPSCGLARLAEAARQEEVPLIDLSQGLGAQRVAEADACFLPDNHLSARGNRLVAGNLLEALRAITPAVPR